jgi:hypothetical protein
MANAAVSIRTQRPESGTVRERVAQPQLPVIASRNR